MLAVQNKSEEMLEALRGINCHPLVVDGEASSADDAIPQIHDEHTIENHVGTILPYTQRKKLEQMSEIALELGKFDEAEGWYRELLGVFPNQWTYWMGLIDSCVIKSLDGVDEEGWKRCQTFANEIIAANDASRKHPALRGPHLFLVELADLKLRRLSSNSTDSKGELLMQLRKAICEYGDQFGPLASCCYADLRCYVELLVKHSQGADGDDISDDVSLVMK